MLEVDCQWTWYVMQLANLEQNITKQALFFIGVEYDLVIKEADSDILTLPS